MADRTACAAQVASAADSRPELNLYLRHDIVLLILRGVLGEVDPLGNEAAKDEFHVNN